MRTGAVPCTGSGLRANIGCRIDGRSPGDCLVTELYLESVNAGIAMDRPASEGILLYNAF